MQMALHERCSSSSFCHLQKKQWDQGTEEPQRTVEQQDLPQLPKNAFQEMSFLAYWQHWSSY